MSSSNDENRQAATNPANHPDPFETGMRAVAHALRDTVPDLSPSDKEFLYDLAREETRYPMPTVRKLCALARRSRNPVAREAFATIVRELCFSDDNDVTVTRSFDLELRSTGPADIAQRQFEKDKNPVTYARVKAALEAQLSTTELALLAVVRWGRQNGLESGQGGKS